MADGGDGDAVMPSVVDGAQSQNGIGDGPAAIVPKDAAPLAASREALGELPVAPAQEVQDVEMEQPDDENEQEQDGDDLFGDGDDDDEQEHDNETAPVTVTLPPMPEPAPAAAPAPGETAIPDLPMPSSAIASKEGTADLDEAELERRRRLEYEEDDAGEPAVEEKQVQYADVKLPKLPMASEKLKLWHAKLPNFLHLEQRAFHAPTWDPKIEQENTNVPVENTIRWRWAPASSSAPGEPRKKQSNARIVRWSDGSLSLQLGSEIFDIATDRAVTTNKAVVPPTGSLNDTSTSTVSGRGSESTTYLVAQHPYAGLMESQAKVTGNLTFRPTTIQSSSHRKMATALSGKHVKTSKTVMMMASHDPELVAKAKAEQEAKAKKAKRAQAGTGDGAAARRKGGRRSVRSSRLDDFSDNEPDDDDDIGGPGAGAADAIAERKRQRMQDKAEMDDFLASESDDEDEDDDDDEEGGGASSKKKKASSGRSRREEEEMDIEDDLDAMEAQAERAAKAARKSKKERTQSAQSASNAGQPPPIMRQQQQQAPVDIDSDDLDADEPIVKQRLVIESDEDE